METNSTMQLNVLNRNEHIINTNQQLQQQLKQILQQYQN